MYNQKLNGMTAVITGGNGVIGGVFARALAGEGADIAIICRNTGSAEGVMKDIRALEREAAVFQGDVLSREDMLRCREEILTRFGHINMLVNKEQLCRRTSIRKIRKKKETFLQPHQRKSIRNLI